MISDRKDTGGQGQAQFGDPFAMQAGLQNGLLKWAVLYHCCWYMARETGNKWFYNLTFGQDCTRHRV